jgi:hypothetical protein
MRISALGLSASKSDWATYGLEKMSLTLALDVISAKIAIMPNMR